MRVVIAFCFVLGFAGCAMETTLEAEFDDHEGDGEDYHGEIDQETPDYDDLADGNATVQSQMRRCTTEGVLALSEQIVQEMQCLEPGSLVRLETGPGIVEHGRAVLPYFAAETVTALEDANSRTSRGILVQSAFRSVVQQHMIYNWRAQRRCRIRAAARPGRSRHESGRAVDLASPTSVSRAMRGAGFVQNVPGDTVHFEYLPAPDLGSTGILAFQRLWNRNRPGERIEENGVYTSATSRAINRAPALGFAIGADCSDLDPDNPEPTPL